MIFHSKLSPQNMSGHRRAVDMVAAIVLSLCILLLAAFSVDGSCYWGDDFAAYISQGIAIAEGRMDEQARLNAFMHPSTLPLEAQNGELVYVWGYPVLLAVIYKFFGFDRVAFSSVVFYKIPSILALALLAGLLFLFYRRRFGFRLSFLFALLFCCCNEMFVFLNTLYSDLVFLFFAVLALYLCELFRDMENGFRRLTLGVFLGLCFWYTYEIRLNGISILITCILAQLFTLRGRYRSSEKPAVMYEFLPYVVFVLLIFLSKLFIPSATSNNSDIGSSMSLTLFYSNVVSYFRLILHWFELLWDGLLISPLYSVLRRLFSLSYENLTGLRHVLAMLSLILTLVGLIFDCREKNAHLGLCIVAYVILASLLPYTQGLRYIYPLLPMLLVFTGYGLMRTTSFPVRYFESLKLLNRPLTLVWFVFCLLLLYPHLSTAFSGEKGIRDNLQIASASDVYMQDAYSPCAVEVYNYIRTETDEDSIFAFFAPRALYLNTERLSIKPGVNGHSLDEADYCLRYLKVGDFPLDPVPGEEFEECFRNDEFILYRKNS